MSDASIWTGPTTSINVISSDLNVLSALLSTLRFDGKDYTSNITLDVDDKLLIGQKSTRLKIPQLLFDKNALDFYDFGANRLELDGTGYAGTDGLLINKGHRGSLHDLNIHNYFQGLHLSGSYVNVFLNSRSEFNSWGGLVEKNSNAFLFLGGGFNHNTNNGLTVQGSYAGTFFGTDFENNTIGLFLDNAANVAGGGAEARLNRVLACYFEGNTLEDIKIGGTAGVEVTRWPFVGLNYHQSTANIGVELDNCDSGLVFFDQYPGTYLFKLVLRANSRNTTIMPFPRWDLAVSSEVFVDAGATVSDYTKQYGYGVVVATNGAGQGSVDVTFRVPYENGFPVVKLHHYSLTPGDATTLPTFRITPLAGKVDFKTGFHIQVITGPATANVNFWWEAGGL